MIKTRLEKACTEYFYTSALSDKSATYLYNCRIKCSIIKPSNVRVITVIFTRTPGKKSAPICYDMFNYHSHVIKYLLKLNEIRD